MKSIFLQPVVPVSNTVANNDHVTSLRISEVISLLYQIDSLKYDKNFASYKNSITLFSTIKNTIFLMF
jgi:hypothetical protein